MTMPGNPSDGELLRRAASIDPASLAILYDRHGSACYALAHRMLGSGSAAEDAVQEAFLHLWRSGSSFDASGGPVRSQLLTHVHTLSLATLRRASFREVPEPRARENTPVSGLSEELDTVLELAYFRGLTEADIAQRLNVPVEVVKTRTRVALEQLRVATRDSSAP